MNAAQFHLATNHLPILIPVVGIGILASGLWLKSPPLRLAALWLFVIGALFAIPTFLSGEPTESIVKNYPNVSRLAIDRHQVAAREALIAIEIVGAASLILLLAARLGRLSSGRWLTVLLFAAIAVFGLMLRTAHLGGMIRHEEIQTEPYQSAIYPLPATR